MTDLVNQTPSQLLWEASSHMLQLMHEGCSYTYPPLYVAMYFFIQLSELKQCRVENSPKVLTPQHRIQTWVLLVQSPKLYSWATVLYHKLLENIFCHTTQNPPCCCFLGGGTKPYMCPPISVTTLPPFFCVFWHLCICVYTVNSSHIFAALIQIYLEELWPTSIGILALLA